jgi:hypothetical protein
MGNDARAVRLEKMRMQYAKAVSDLPNNNDSWYENLFLMRRKVKGTLPV